MSYYHSRTADFFMRVVQATTQILDGVGAAAEQDVAAHTPVDTHWAEQSIHHVVINNGGAQVAGTQADRNGQPPPLAHYPQRSEDLTLFVGSNTEARVATWGDTTHAYYFGLEMGFSPQGQAMLADGLDLATRETETQLQTLRTRV